MYIIATYGSLRKGFHNHKWLGKAKLLGTSKIKGIMQLVQGAYPFLFHKNEIKTDKEELEHKIEIYQVDKEVYEYINEIETQSGYKAETLETPFGKATIWITNPVWYNDTTPDLKAYTLSIYNLKQHA